MRVSYTSIRFTDSFTEGHKVTLRLPFEFFDEPVLLVQYYLVRISFIVIRFKVHIVWGNKTFLWIEQRAGHL